MIPRILEAEIKRLSRKFPIIMLTGPRQSGKSTLLQHAFPNKEYISLEDPDQRIKARQDPRTYLENFSEHGAILDEVQRVPEMFSYLQTVSDKENKPGKFILSGSQNFLLMKSVTQSLAGRVAILKLLPLSVEELQASGMKAATMESFMFRGFYPRLYDKKIRPTDFYPNYFESYLQRDVRELKNVGDLGKFHLFVKMCAARIGSLLNTQSLANDCGVSQPTAKAWLSILEASYVIHYLRPYSKNFNRRLVKMPKLYFYDTGLACSLLDVTNEKTLLTHSLRGHLFENFMVGEVAKYYFNQAMNPPLYFWRDKSGNEVDLLIEKGSHFIPIEIKSGKTFVPEYFKGIEYLQKVSGLKMKQQYVIYGGDRSTTLKAGKIISWRDLEFLK